LGFWGLNAFQKIKNKQAEIEAYPALQHKEGKIVLTLIGDELSASITHGQAVLVLIMQLLGDKLKYLQKKLPLQKACLCYAPYGTCHDLTQQIIDRALMQLVPKPENIRTQVAFEVALEEVRLRWIDTAQHVAKQVSELLIQHQNVAKRIRGRVNPRSFGSISDIKVQLEGLIAKDFVRNTPETWFKQIVRYLKGVEVRLEKIEQDPSKDASAIRQIQPILAAYERLSQEEAYQNRADLVELRWWIEELRLSLFAQPMKTLKPISIKRIEKNIKALG